MNPNQVPGAPGIPGAGFAPPAMPAQPQGVPQVTATPAVPPVATPQAPAVAATAAPSMAFDLDMNAIRQQAEELNAMSQNRRRESDFAAFGKGVNFIRCLPPWSAEVAAKGQFTRFHQTHFNILEKESCSCWESSLPNMGFRCPICHIRNTFGRYMGDMISNTAPRPYHYANAVVYTSPDNGASFLYKRLKPFVLRLPVTVWTGFMQMMQKPYIGNITGVDNGWIIAVNKPESFRGKSGYTWQQVVQGPLAPDENTKNAILNDMHDLDKFGDFGVPTVEKLQRQFQLAESMLQWACQILQVTDPASQIPGFGKLELIVPDVVYQVHGQPQTVVGMPGSAAPMAAPAAAAPMAAPAAAPAPAALSGPAPAGTGMFPSMPVGGPAAPPAIGAAPMAAPPAAAPAPAPLPAPGVQGGGVSPLPFPPAPAPQQEASPPSEGVGEPKTETTQKNGKVKCPGCGKDYSGQRGLKVHLNKSEACKKAAEGPPAAMSEVAAPSPSPAPAGMAPPQWSGGQNGPFPPTS